MGRILNTILAGALALSIGGCAGVKYRSDDKGFYEVRFGEYGCIADTQRSDGKEVLTLDGYGTIYEDVGRFVFFGEKVTNPKSAVEYQIRECDTCGDYITLDRQGDSKRWLPRRTRQRVKKTYDLLKECENLLEKKFDRDF